MEFSLKVSAQDIQIISNALGQRPYAEVAALVTNLQAQLTEQKKPKEKTNE